MDLIEKIYEVFDKERKLEEDKKILKDKYDELFKEKVKIAFELYSEFIKNNPIFDKNAKYYKLYIDSGYFIVEELMFNHKFNDFVDFKHKSEHRQHILVNLHLNIKEDEYENDSVIIDEKQFNRLAKQYKVIIRE
ncbi:hypothetical protein DEFDS_0393 [Deferribacter desulfuricans SSM1]|uniref:Uncharacterized protein n=1 Tax=Deferribacter desulfuricans (strain DSM 14783 / JCM 11476 / NBRC 101012 / SSM1) TaxID=639282 RepID=D3PBB4_DEFDS|nr:hypothetical protein [Deferribacter desulfuricans]BAI79887.1 hypothetical protein DEFDS_0393 [Deferribacter desulfuricans SSM1]